MNECTYCLILSCTSALPAHCFLCSFFLKLEAKELEAKASAVSREDPVECKEGDTASGTTVGVSCEGESSVPSLQVQEEWPNPPPLSTDETIDGSEAEGAGVEQLQLDEQTQEQPVTPTQGALVYLMYVEFSYLHTEGFLLIHIVTGCRCSPCCVQ